MKDTKTTCDPCEQDFRKKVNELVREGRAPSHAEREKRAHEVKSAFTGEQIPRKQAERPTAPDAIKRGTPAKEPATAHAAARMKK